MSNYSGFKFIIDVVNLLNLSGSHLDTANKTFNANKVSKDTRKEQLNENATLSFIYFSTLDQKSATGTTNCR